MVPEQVGKVLAVDSQKGLIDRDTVSLPGGQQKVVVLTLMKSLEIGGVFIRIEVDDLFRSLPIHD